VKNGNLALFKGYPSYSNDSNFVKNSKYGFSRQITQENGQEILNEVLQARKNDLPSISRIKLTKNYKEKKFNLNLSSYLTYNYQFEGDMVFDWEMTGKSDTLMGMVVFQATTQYGGRLYKAWYTPEIPISDGPYVFSGLPGLIVQVKDERYWYVFKLKSIDLNPSSVEFYEPKQIGSPHMLTRTQFVDMLRKEKNDPKLIGLMDVTQSALLSVKSGMLRKFDYLMESY
jgi:GLPGLI family protein